MRIDFPEAAAAETPATGLRTRILTAFDTLEQLASDWERLWSADPKCHVFLSLPWVRAWWRAHGRAHRLCTPVVWDGDRVIGILPMVREGDSFHFLGSPDSDYTDVLCEEARTAEVLEAAFGALLAAVPAGGRCVLENLPQTSRIVRSLDHLPAALRRNLGLVFKASCPAIVAGIPDDDPYRPLSRKESIRRHDKKLNKLGPVQLRHLESRAEILAHFPTFIAQHITRRALAGDRSLLLSPEAVEFYMGLVEGLDPRSDLRFAVLQAGSIPLAYHLGFEVSGKFIWYKPTFDIDYWDWSAGEVLIGRLLDYASTRGVAEFDFTLGDEAFKYRFANVVRRLYTLQLYPAGVRGRIRRICDSIKETAKQQPKLSQAVKSLRTAAERYRKSAPVASAVRRWSRAVFAHDRVGLLCAAGTQGPNAAAAGRFEIRKVAVSDLARFSLDHPDALRSQYLHEARARFKAGDTCYVALRQGRLAQIAWVGMRTEISAPNAEPPLTLSFDEAAPVLFDYWTAPSERFEDVFPALSARILQAETAGGSKLWMCRRPADGSTRRGIAKAHFQAARRLSRVRLFGRLNFTRSL